MLFLFLYGIFLRACISTSFSTRGCLFYFTRSSSSITPWFFWFLCSWPVAFISKFLPLPEKQYHLSLTGCCGKRKVKRTGSKQTNAGKSV